MTVKIGIIGGSGLDDPDFLKDRKEKLVTTVFGDPSDVLIEGEIQGVPCVLLARHGRQHSIMPGKVNYRANIWALKQEGCTHVLVSTATGSLQEHIHPGDIVIPNSFIDRTQGRAQTFYDGEADSPKGVCHLPMEPAFCERTRQIIIEIAHEEGIDVHETGTVVAIEGPRFCSKAESLMLRQWGGHLINMTTVPEVVLAKEAGLLYAAIAIATDYDCWKTTGERVCVGDVLETFKKNVNKVIKLITLVVPRIADEKWDTAINELKETVQNNVMLPKECFEIKNAHK